MIGVPPRRSEVVPLDTVALRPAGSAQRSGDNRPLVRSAAAAGSDDRKIGGLGDAVRQACGGDADDRRHARGPEYDKEEEVGESRFHDSILTGWQNPPQSQRFQDHSFTLLRLFDCCKVDGCKVEVTHSSALGWKEQTVG